jgi:hypothetical protein
MSTCASYLTFFCPHSQRFIDPKQCISCTEACKYATPHRRPKQ